MLEGRAHRRERARNRDGRRRRHQSDQPVEGDDALGPADQELAGRVFARIEAEFTRSREMVLLVSGYTQLMQNEPVVQRSIHLRNPYVDALSHLQLRALRAMRNRRTAPADRRRAERVFQLSVNGVAAGLQNTG